MFRMLWRKIPEDEQARLAAMIYSLRSEEAAFQNEKRYYDHLKCSIEDCLSKLGRRYTSPSWPKIAVEDDTEVVCKELTRLTIETTSFVSGMQKRDKALCAQFRNLTKQHVPAIEQSVACDSRGR